MLTEYLYRTQEKIPITDGKVTINGESFELSDLVKFPFNTEGSSDIQFVISAPSSETEFPITIEGGGVTKKIMIQKKPHPNINESFIFESIGYLPFVISYTLNKRTQVSMLILK